MAKSNPDMQISVNTRLMKIGVHLMFPYVLITGKFPEILLDFLVKLCVRSHICR